MSGTAKWIAIGIGVALLLFALDRLALWMEARGWLYYRRSDHRPSGTLGNAFLEIQSMVDPGKRIVLEERRREKTSESQSGDPPDPPGTESGLKSP